jgi:cytochrome c5
VSKQDSHFITVFSLVIGTLATVAIVIFVIARYVGAHTQEREVLSETEYIHKVRRNVAPFEAEAIAGQSNAGLAIAPAAGAASGGGLSMPTTGKQLFEQTCSACHGPGIAGAPKAGDKAAWAPHLAKGLATLYDHALHGFHGSTGVMPAKGGRANLPDVVVERAVNYMVSLVDPQMVKGKPK